MPATPIKLGLHRTDYSRFSFTGTKKTHTDIPEQNDELLKGLYTHLSHYIPYLH